MTGMRWECWDVWSIQLYIDITKVDELLDRENTRIELRVVIEQFNGRAAQKRGSQPHLDWAAETLGDPKVDDGGSQKVDNVGSHKVESFMAGKHLV